MIRDFARRVANRLRFEVTVMRASRYRRKLNDVTFVGITGSAGKTTVKNLTTSILSTDGTCSTAFSGQNELFFNSQVILSTKETDKYGVLEIHGGGPGVMDKPLEIIRPDIGVLTNIGSDHFKSFANKDDIASEKRKIVDRLPKHGVAVLNRDDPEVKKIGERCKCRTIWVGRDDCSTIRLIESRSVYPEPLTLVVEYNNRVYELKTRLHGVHLAPAVLISIGVALAAKLPFDLAMKAACEVPPVEGRMQAVTTADGVNFIRDDFKAPYWSIDKPIEFLSNARVRRKIAVFGTISDYSHRASRLYVQLARLARSKADIVVFVGSHALRALKARDSEADDTLLAFPEIRDAATYLKNELREGDLVLLKGSNRIDHLERLVLDRDSLVRCWTGRCRLAKFCENCERLDVEPPPGDSPVRSAQVMREPLRPVEPKNRWAGKILIGLGNPGARYENTPHNVGQQALEMLDEGQARCWKSEPEGAVREFRIAGTTLFLFKPSAEMNVSGSAVRKFVERQGCTHRDCILIHDDLDLPLGEVRVKTDGGDGGHKGVRSVIMALGTGRFQRIRIGVRPKTGKKPVKKYVLSTFGRDEKSKIRTACQQVHSLIEEGLVAVADEVP